MNFGRKYLLAVAVFTFATLATFGQEDESKGKSKGHLFIIGGGERSTALIGELVKTASLRPNDYIVVLPMATSVPEESVAYISEQLSEHTDHPISSFNFTRATADDRLDWIDSVRNARLIYMTGGDQNKFMEVVRGSKLYEAMHEAYRNGATISGTSAGAAVMSHRMITGAQRGDEDGSFREVKSDYAVTESGMGFLTNSVIDQHFIYRSRYNRLLSVLSDQPKLMMIGIDEGTAVIVSGKHARVVGDSQVVVVSGPKKLRASSNDKVSFRNARLSLYVHGQTFKLK